MIRLVLSYSTRDAELRLSAPAVRAAGREASGLAAEWLAIGERMEPAVFDRG